MRYIKFTLDNSKSLNKELLRLIHLHIFKNKITENRENVYTDYGTKDNASLPYIKVIQKALEPCLKTLLKKHLFADKVKYDGLWFQSYTKTQYHSWHTHQGCQFSAVYYVELPNIQYATEFYDLETHTIYTVPNVKEGDCIIFPSYIPHRSPINKSKQRKTVISFNLNIYETNLPPHSSH